MHRNEGYRYIIITKNKEKAKDIVKNKKIIKIKKRIKK